MSYFMGADLRLPTKDAPPSKPIYFDFLDDIARVRYWIRSGDWPEKGSIRTQAPKVRMIARLVYDALDQRDRNDSVRLALMMRGLGG